MHKSIFGVSAIADIQDVFSFFPVSVWTAITYLGDGLIPLLLFVVACAARRIEFALSMGIISSATGIAVGISKQIIQEPRPYLISDEFAVHAMGSGFGMPSGHSATGLITFFVIGLFLNNRRYFYVLIPLIVLIGLSRVYLGVHTLGQVAVGWIISLMVLGLHLVYKNDKASISPVLNKSVDVTLLLLSVLLFLAFHFYIDMSVGPQFVIPEEWAQKDLRAYSIVAKLDARDEYSPLSLFQPERIVLVGLYLGICLSGIWYRKSTDTIKNDRWMIYLNALFSILAFGGIVYLSTLFNDNYQVIFVAFLFFPIFAIIISPAVCTRLRSVITAPRNSERDRGG